MQQFVARVIQSARNKTAKVVVERSVKEKKFLKPVKISKNYFVHDECNNAAVGDIVEIVYQGKGDKNKYFRINQTLKESQKFINPFNGASYSS